MKRLFVLLAALTALAAMVAGSAVAGGSAAPKATGDIWFVNSGYGPGTHVVAHWVFNAQEATQNSPVKGNMTYEDENGSYTAKVTAVHVDGPNADITAEVTSSTYPYAQPGTTFSWTVHDVAEPGVGQDYFTYLPSGGAPMDLPAITAGNIQVHS
jgi:hypothetical protein